MVYYFALPPHTRGTPDDDLLSNPPLRVTPTYAGNTFCEIVLIEHVSGYPHVCGEHRFSARAASLLAGLPPTYAGNTPGGHPNRSGVAGYPHVRGEHESIVID